ncbi:MAG: hypothetical protein QMD14_04110 [Candidatus Aenigmarchaeota archaeon]|nr:hypothetical protein [Candidatus Aenigmarchaeota archaeon]
MWYFIVEVLIAIVLLVGMLFITYATERTIEMETLYVKSRIWNGLKAMDDAGMLRSYAIANKSEEIKNSLSQLLPGIPFEVSICYEPCVITLPYEQVVSISYFLTGDYGNFKSTVVMVSTWLE